MINLFTLQARIHTLQREVLAPLYTMHFNQELSDHDQLMADTGKVIEANRPFLEELAASSLIAAIFAIVKLFGGADQLSHDDFNRFTGYVNDGGLKAMVKMLHAKDKEKTFLDELQLLPLHIKENAPIMLSKSAVLHDEFIAGYFKTSFGAPESVPTKLIENRDKSTAFIKRLASLAEEGR